MNGIAALGAVGIMFLIAKNFSLPPLLFLSLAVLVYFIIFVSVNRSLLKEGFVMIKNNRK